MDYLKVEFFVPQEHLATIIEALNQAGFLREGNYDYCYAYTPVKGHFRPLDNAQPFIGQTNVIEEVDEVKVEFRIESQNQTLTLELIKQHHPYEVPVINFMRLV
ncbi:hypothetical protein [Fundicoccus culcitae]|uniref:Cytochrome C biogenesis protein n=1 Tax=Fundicoccus culcitae TaxID=2969821 RepID=A0ABY5P3K3_9LACT|nr:hypothetical protein [Fundicoccus culcitae]UUX33311.1 hypothetical protein NRE15_10415 [Fundicoccus culcitae]